MNGNGQTFSEEFQFISASPKRFSISHHPHVSPGVPPRSTRTIAHIYLAYRGECLTISLGPLAGLPKNRQRHHHSHQALLFVFFGVLLFVFVGVLLFDLPFVAFFVALILVPLLACQRCKLCLTSYKVPRSIFPRRTQICAHLSRPCLRLG